MASLFTTTLMLGVALAQTTTLTLPFIGYDQMTLQASVVSAKPSQTVFALACPSGTDANDCGLFPQQLLTYGPSVYIMDMSEPGDDDFTMTQDCSVGPQTAICKESASGSEANFPGSSTETYTEVTSMPVTITAGAEKLAASAEATVTSSGSGSESESVATSSGAQTSTGTLSTATQTGNATSSSASGASASASNTGAAGRNMASNVGLVGAAGLFAGLLM